MDYAIRCNLISITSVKKHENITLEILNQAPTYQLVHQTLHDLMMHQGGELHHTSGKEEGDFLYLSPDNLHGDKPDRSKTMYSNFLKLNTVEPHHDLKSP